MHSMMHPILAEVPQARQRRLATNEEERGAKRPLFDVAVPVRLRRDADWGQLGSLRRPAAL